MRQTSFISRARVVLAGVALTTSLVPAALSAQPAIWSKIVGPQNVTGNNTPVRLRPGGDGGALATVGLQVEGTFSGTITLRCSISGNTYVALDLIPRPSGATVTSVSAAGLWKADATGCRIVEATPSSWASGTAVVTLLGTSNGGGAASAELSGEIELGEVTVTASALPTGAATAANQATSNTNLATIANAVSGSGFQLSSAGVIATVIDLTNSNPVATRPVDSNGDAMNFTADVTVDLDTDGGDTQTAAGYPILLPSASGGVTGGTSTAPIRVDPTGTTSQPVSGANSLPLIVCNSSVAISTATSGNVELVALTGGQTVYVCAFDVTSAGDVNVQFISGTGTACATGETDKTGTYQLIAPSGGGLRGLARGSGVGTLFRGASGEAVCIELSAAVQVDGLLTYAKF
jgi:hypothetical protein